MEFWVVPVAGHGSHCRQNRRALCPARDGRCAGRGHGGCNLRLCQPRVFQHRCAGRGSSHGGACARGAGLKDSHPRFRLRLLLCPGTLGFLVRVAGKQETPLDVRSPVLLRCLSMQVSCRYLFSVPGVAGAVERQEGNSYFCSAAVCCLCRLCRYQCA